ncbi:uncharacterized protein LOC108024395 isoform X1 [Drosophila biarmipes]|uniref:uncharacterized protein LOC108024395 isoform X1 n=1 Tax=Drosophila biarmipes TaxID=125945 RepID=UPI0007E8910B|nr:uncharacterized protein LOC108024395 isoform X1 [Drosophila biarmipes]
MKEKRRNRKSTSGPDREQPGSSNAVNPEDNPSDMENQPLSPDEDDQAVPFILVDCAAYTVRSDLEAVLSQVEKERMEKVQAHIGDTPQLEDVSPPPELDLPINLSSRALAELKNAEDERRFQEDLKNFRVDGVDAEEEERMTLSERNLLLQTTANLEQIRLKLEQLKKLQEEIMLESEESVLELTASAEAPERPGLRREGTFDIERDDEKKVNHPEISTKVLSKVQKSIPTTEQIISQIGELLMKLQLKQEDRKLLTEGSSYSYMVTIKPAGGASNCTVRAITKLKSRDSKIAIEAKKLKTSKAPLINIFSPASLGERQSSMTMTNHGLDESSFGPMSLPETSSSRVKSPFLRRRACSYLKVPTPARFCHGKKRD